MRSYFSRVKFTGLSLALVLLCYAICRILFYLFNLEAFPGVGFGGLLSTLFHGLPFDICVILYSSIVFLLLGILPFNLFQYRSIRMAAKTMFLLPNSIALFANCADFAYFGFIHKRTTYDVFALMGSQTDMGQLLPLFLRDFWYIFVITIAFVIVLNWCYNRLFRRYVAGQEEPLAKGKPILYKSLLFLAFCGITVIGMRGGLQLIPLGIVNAGDEVSPDKVPLVLNTPFSIVKSLELSTLEEKHYFSEAEADKIIGPCKRPADTAAFRPLNVVIIILESFSKEYTGLSGQKSYTPFLDSLMGQSYTFVNAYANGKRSIEGIPCVLSATPSFQEAYLNTLYTNNDISSIASLLKQKGYNSSFFHGGTNGTMSFDSYCRMAGIDAYYGRTQYANEADYDGSWGIWDEPFFQWYAQKLDGMKQPFVSSVFSLSSHHPFAIPEKYKQQFPEGTLPIHKCVRYTDHSLRRFFNTASQAPWFSNTLFVITADHTGPTSEYGQAGIFQIPVVFYRPDGSLKGQDPHIVQQIDIMAGILHQLQYDQPYFSFGNDPFEAKEHYAVNFDSERYRMIWNNNMLIYNDRTDEKEYYRISGKGIVDFAPAERPADSTEAANKLKALIQEYNNRLIHNQTTCK